MLRAPAIIENLRARSLQHWLLIMLGIVGVAAIFWKVSPVLTGFAHRVQGYEFLTQALEILGDQNPEPDYCVRGGISEASAKGLVHNAIESLEAAQEAMPTDSKSRLLLGRAHCLSGNFEEAIAGYQAYTELRPNNPLGHLELGFAYEALCAEGYVKASEDSSATIAIPSCVAPDLRPKILTAWQVSGVTEQEFFNAGEEAREAEDFDEAITWYGRATALSPKWAEPWQRTGLVYQELGTWDQAAQAFQSAWQYDPEVNTSNLAIALRKQGNLQIEEEVLRQALETFPNSSNRLIWWQSLGENLTLQEKMDQSVNAYQEAIREFPNDQNLHISLGWAYYESGHGIDAALEEFKLASLLDDEIGEGYFATAQLLVQEERYAEADLWFKKAIEKEPERRGWYIFRGNAARADANLLLAIQVYEELQQFDPNYDPGYYEMAWAYYLLGQSDMATESIEKAIALSATPKPWYYIRLGLIYEDAGSYDEALRAYHQAIKLDPENPTAKQAIERLTDKNTP